MSENKSWNSNLLSDIQLLSSKPNIFSEYQKQTKCSAILNTFRMAYMLWEIVFIWNSYVVLLLWSSDQCTDMWPGQGASHMIRHTIWHN